MLMDGNFSYILESFYWLKVFCKLPALGPFCFLFLFLFIFCPENI